MFTSAIAATIALASVSIPSLPASLSPDINLSPDTVYVYDSPQSLRIVESDGKVDVTITDADGQVASTSATVGDNAIIRVGDFSVRDRLDFDDHWFVSSGGLHFGFIAAPGFPGDNMIEMGKSFQIGWSNIVALGYRQQLFEATIGFGLDWRNYKSTASDMRFASDGRQVTIEPYPDGQRRYSRIKLFALQIPIQFTQKMPFRFLGHRQAISLGVNLNYAPHASILTRYTDTDGRQVKLRDNTIAHRRFFYDLTATLHLTGDLGIYFSYTPLSLLRGHNQPTFSTLSTGLTLFL